MGQQSGNLLAQRVPKVVVTHEWKGKLGDEAIAVDEGEIGWKWN
jgi:hypothetical protein